MKKNTLHKIYIGCSVTSLLIIIFVLIMLNELYFYPMKCNENMKKYFMEIKIGAKWNEDRIPGCRRENYTINTVLIPQDNQLEEFPDKSYKKIVINFENIFEPIWIIIYCDKTNTIIEKQLYLKCVRCYPTQPQENNQSPDPSGAKINSGPKNKNDNYQVV